MTSEGRFWNWFQAHDSALFAVKTGNEPICGELSEELHRVHPTLTFEFGPADSGRREFVLSADGIKDAFPAVLALGRVGFIKIVPADGRRPGQWRPLTQVREAVKARPPH